MERRKTNHEGSHGGDAYPAELLGVAEAIGDLMEYWGFKRIHGALWALLYLSSRPLSQQELSQRSGYSKGAVSMALGELQEWGVVHSERPLGGRERLYRPETDLGAMIRRVLARRERGLLERARDRFRVARRFAAADPGSSWLTRRLDLLIGLTEAGLWTLQSFVRSGRLPFARLRRYFERGLAVDPTEAASAAHAEPLEAQKR